jgi:uncharacterized protein with PIN domain
MPKGMFRFYEELNDFLPKRRRKNTFQTTFKGKRSIKDMIEALGVPHAQVDLILVNGISVNFNYILKNGDRVSVYPVFESLNITEVTRLRKIPLRRHKYLADIDLGNIVRFMRVLGFDVYYDSLLSTRKIIEISKRENRIILTRSRKLLKFNDVTHGIFIHPGTTTEQIRRIIDHLDIKDNIKPFSRCPRCNTLLKTVSKEKILYRNPPRTTELCDENVQCPSCNKIYWKDTHFINMKKVIKRILFQTES